MVPGYLLNLLRQLSGKLSMEREKFHEVTLLQIWNSNQKFTNQNLNRNNKHRKRTNQKRIEKV